MLEKCRFLLRSESEEDGHQDTCYICGEVKVSIPAGQRSASTSLETLWAACRHFTKTTDLALSQLDWYQYNMYLLNHR